MLKNKFGMVTRVLVIVLSVLMMASLAACKKDDSALSSDEMNSAIQSAIDAANKAQQDKADALASSIAADKAAQEAKDAAIASSIAADKAAQEAALKKAQEEAAAAAKAAEAASKAAKEAADKAKAEAEKAAKDAADKAASEAAKKAEESLKALEEALKKAQEEAAKASEQLAQLSSKVEETPVIETTVVPGPSGPIVIVDKTDVLEAYSKLKTEYTYTKDDMYLAENYEELVLLFDKAAIDIQNAATVEAAVAVLEGLKVDVLGIENVENAAAKVQDLIADLGDIETEVFTTQAEKIVEARDAYVALKTAYCDYFDYDVEEEQDGTAKDKNNKTYNKTEKTAKDLGINLGDLKLAEAKLDVLEAYIGAALKADMLKIHNIDTKHRFDVEDDLGNYGVALINGAYYKYLVLAAINNGDVAEADLAIDWEYKVDENGDYVKVDGKKVLDYDKPIDWFTVEELLDVFVLPTLDYELALYIDNDQNTGLLDLFKKAMAVDGLYNEVKTAVGINAPDFKDIDSELDDVYLALEDELTALSFTEDFKGNVTLADAKEAVSTTAIKAYIDALNVYFEAAKAVAIEREEAAVELAIEGGKDAAGNDVEGWLEKIELAQDKLDDDELSSAAVERINGQIAGYQAKIDGLNADLTAFKANVEAAALLTYEEMLNEDLAETDDYDNGKWADLADFDDVTPAAKKTFLNLVLTATIKNNFTADLDVVGEDETVEELNALIEWVVNDLYALRDRVSPYAEDEKVATIFNLKDDAGEYVFRGDAYEYLGDYYFANTPVFEEAVAIIDTAIAAIEAETADKYEATNELVPNGDGKKFYYFKSAAAQTHAVENEMTIEEIIDDSTLWTNTANDYPITYVYTAAEKAAEQVAKLYLDAFKAVNAKIVTLDGIASDYRKVISNEGKSGVTKTAYDNLLGTVSGTLKAEMKEVGDKYLSGVSSAVTTFKNQFPSNKEWKTTDWFVKETKLDKTKIDTDNDGTADAFCVANIVKIKLPTTSLAATYDPQGYKDDVVSQVNSFMANFWKDLKKTGDEYDVDDKGVRIPTATTAANSKVNLLWIDKLAMVDKINTEMAKYKNQYVALTGDDAGKFEVSESATIYKYSSGDDILSDAGKQILNKSEVAIAYEAALDTLTQTYIDKVMAVKIGSGYLTIKNGMGSVVTSKNNVADSTAKYKWNGDKDDGGARVNYNLDAADAALNAYYDALFGTADYTVTVNNDATGKTYPNGNSEIFKIYNTEVLKNTYGYAKVVAG